MIAQVSHPWEVPATGPAAALAAQVASPTPRLETARLMLRAPVIADFRHYAEILMSDRARFMDGPFEREAAWLDFCQYSAGWMLRGAGMFTIKRRDTDAVVGFVTMGMEFGDQEHELGFLLLENAEGNGYASEAAAAVRDFAFGSHDLPALVSYIDPSNTASARVATRIGALRDTNAERAFDVPVHVFRHFPVDTDGSPEAYA